jgi:outer membrane protein TolC
MIYLFIISCFSFNLLAQIDDEKEWGLKKSSHPELITLQRAFILAQEHNFEFKRVQARLIQAQSKVWLQTSHLLPSLSFGINRDLRAPESTKASLVFTLPLFDSKNILSSKAEHELLKAERLNSYYAHEKLIYEVAYLYSEALIARSARDLAQEEQEKFLKYQQLIARKIKIGSARALDLTSAHYQSNKSASDFYIKEREYQNSLAKLGAHCGLNETFDLALFSIKSPTLALPADILVSMAQKTSEITALEKELSASRYNLASEASSFLPTLKASADNNWTWTSKNRDFSNQIMLNLEFALFNGGSTIAQIRHHRAEITINKLNLREKETQKYLSVLGNLDRIIMLKKSQASSELALLAAQQAADSTERLFAQGALTTLDLKDASLQLFSAKSDFAEATLNLIQSQLSLLLLVGKMSDLIN